MSDVPPPDLPPEEPPDEPLDNGTGLTDEQLAALVEWLTPALSDMMMAAIGEAQEGAPKIAMSSGTVLSVTVNDGTTTGGSATLDMDGDEAGGEIIAQIIGETPLPDDRVMVMFVPPSSAFVVGMVGGGGMPAGVLVATVRNITSTTASASATAPDRGYFWPYGQVIKQNKAPNLNRVLGTRFNTGGEATDEVRLPDARGRMLIGMDNMGGSDAGRHSLTNTVGTVGGAETHTLSTSNMPNHAHTFTPTGSISGISASGSTSTDGYHQHSVGGQYFWTTGSPGSVQAGASYDGHNGLYTAVDGAGSHSHTFSFSGASGTFSGSGGTTSYEGSGSSVNHLPPVMVVHWMIKG